MGQKVHTDDGSCDVDHDEPPREVPAYTEVEAERQPSVGLDVSAISTEVVVHALPVSRNEPAWIYAEVGALVDQELPFTMSVNNEEAALRCGADTF
jgi:hypothetical protein